MARILIIDDDINLLQMVRVMLERVGHEVETASSGERGIAAAAESQPDLAIIDVMMPELSGYDVVREFRANPATANILIMIFTARSQPVDKQMALDAGANSFLSKPVMAKELTARVEAVLEAGVNFRVHTGPLVEPRPSEDSTRPVTPPDASPSAAPAARAGLAAPGKPITEPLVPGHKPIGADDPVHLADIPPSRLPVITILSLRGGTGCTTVAVNLAALLAKTGRQVCVTDLSAAGGHVQMHLHFSVKHSWGDLVPMGDIPDPRVLKEIVTTHPSTNIDVFPAPTIPTPHILSDVATQNVLRELATTHNPVIVDSGHLDSAAVGALAVSGLVVVVMADDPPSVQTTGQTLIALNKMGVQAAHVRVVLNHTRPEIAVPTPTIQKALKRPVTAELPYDPAHAVAIRRGLPLVLATPDSEYALAVQQMARTLLL